MKYFADIHIHSRFSVATSRNLVPESLEYWARLKGINLLGTGDCIHPGWYDELQEKLEDAGNGFFRLKNEYRLRESKELRHENIPDKVLFILSGEISTIYKKDGRTRKVHSLCIFPDFSSVKRLQERLDRIGNIRSDGRPILGLDSRDLLEMVLDTGQKSFFIPAHIWTPWFSVLGSKSGFDSLQECFGDMEKHIFAVETGLSSDPAMNRTCSFLDRYTMVSNSDAHSPEKLGREATVLDTGLDYDSFLTALKGNGGYIGTLEFFPQEGKYHYDGHRKCGVRWDPLETELHGGTCPVCKKEVTKGVMYRVAELADRSETITTQENFRSITQLPEILAEMIGQKSGSSKKVTELYHRLVRAAGSEFYILLDADARELETSGGEMLAEGIMRLRRGDVAVEEGYDGEFGSISVFRKGEPHGEGSGTLFGGNPGEAEHSETRAASIKFDISRFRLMKQNLPGKGMVASGEFEFAGSHDSRSTNELTDQQRSAVEYMDGPCMVIAGPGTGKTRVLVERIRHLIRSRRTNPEDILAVTFSNRATGELIERIGGEYAGKVRVSTLHSLGLSILRDHYNEIGWSADFRIIGEIERFALLKEIARNEREARQLVKTITARKNGIIGEESDEWLDRYNAVCRENDLLDLDDLILLPADLLENRKEIREEYRIKFRHILVDEFQDINAPQYRMIQSLARDDGTNLFIIGDPDQAIYGFRGASVHFIDEFVQKYPGTKILTLKKSHRCPDPVLKSARKVIMGDDGIDGIGSVLKISISTMESSRSEADFIAAEIERSLGGVRSFSRDSGISDGSADKDDLIFSDFAILCRSSFMFDEMAEALINHGIPYQVIDNEPFYKKKHFIDIIANLKQCRYNLHEDKSKCMICPALREGAQVTSILKILLEGKDVSEHDIKRMTAISDSYGNDVAEFLRRIELGRGADDYDERASTVTVMTIHQSKGLEFDTVFIPGCEEGIIPFTLFGDTGEDRILEEERLLYVAMTRSKRRLYISHARTRKYRERTLMQPRSRFIDRIEKQYVQLMERDPLKKERSDQLTLF